MEGEMTSQSFSIDAASDHEARHRGAEILQVDPSFIRLQPDDHGGYQISRFDPGQGVTVHFLSGPQRQIFIDLSSLDSSGHRLSRSALLAGLHRSALLVEPQDQGLDRLLAEINETGGGDELHFEPAQPIRPPDGSRFQLTGDSSRPVFPGDRIAALKPISNHEGSTEAQTEDQPDPAGISGPPSFELFDAAGCTTDETGQHVIANRYGLAVDHEETIRVEPLLSVSGDGCSLRATLYDRDAFGSPITPERLEALLEPFADGLRFRSKGVRTALEKASNSGRPQPDVALAVSRPPRQGRDGVFVMASNTDDSEAGEADFERLDPRERNLFLSLGAGETIGHLYPAEPGTPGLDVFGNRLPAKAGTPKELEAGDNVELGTEEGQDRVTVFTAAIPGVVSFHGNQVSISEVLEISGDVDYSTGNIVLERGSVTIAGNVNPGFSVQVPREIFIQGMADDARIEAGGNVTIKGGIVAEHSGWIKAGDNLEAQFAENAHIEAGGDVVIRQDITNCRITAQGKVLCTSGRGNVQGGRLQSTAGIEVNQAGSRLGVPTTLAIVSELQLDAELLEERQALRDQIQKIADKLGPDDLQSLRSKLSEEKLAAMSRLLEIKAESERRLKGLEESLRQQKRRQLEQLQSARIQVMKTVHPDTAIVFQDQTEQITETMAQSTFRFDPRTKSILTE
jgi:hypothetical protein